MDMTDSTERARRRRLMLALGATFFVGVSLHGWVRPAMGDVPHLFATGNVISAESMNANFKALEMRAAAAETANDLLEERVAALEGAGGAGPVPEDIEELHASINTPDIDYGTEVTACSGLAVDGIRVGNTFSLGFRLTCNISTGDNHDVFAIDANNFAFLAGRTVERAHGTFITGVHTSGTGSLVAGFVAIEAPGGVMRWVASGQFQSQTARAFVGTMTIVAPPES